MAATKNDKILVPTPFAKSQNFSKSIKNLNDKLDEIVHSGKEQPEGSQGMNLKNPSEDIQRTIKRVATRKPRTLMRLSNYTIAPARARLSTIVATNEKNQIRGKRNKRELDCEKEKLEKDLNHQKQVMEELKEEQDKLKKDRSQLMLEIKNMKTYLDVIKAKLDQSLLSLASKKTLFSQQNRKMLATKTESGKKRKVAEGKYKTLSENAPIGKGEASDLGTSRFNLHSGQGLINKRTVWSLFETVKKDEV